MDWNFCWEGVPIEKLVALLGRLFDCRFTDESGNLVKEHRSDSSLREFVRRVSTRPTDECYIEGYGSGSNRSSEFGIHPERPTVSYFTANSSREIRYDLETHTLEFSGVGNKSEKLRRAIGLFLGAVGKESPTEKEKTPILMVPRPVELFELIAGQAIFTGVDYPDKEKSQQFFNRLNQIL